MPWIHLPDDEETPALERVTRPYRKQGRPVPAVIAIMKPNPKALRGVLAMNNGVTFGGSVLGRRREELIASVTSALNDCFY
ncbi:MAG: hypothetical protein KDA24_22750 [Deltaproteobacteria bacterium]|nr:hypothetical protein [Deltaproteobacteria bacterium]